MQRSRVATVMMVAVVSLLMAACNTERVQLQPTFTPIPSATLPPLMTDTPSVIVPTVNAVMVTLPPPPSLTPLPSATVPYDMMQYLGNWILSLNVNVLGMPRFNDVRFSGVGQLAVTAQGHVSGRISFSARVTQPRCVMAVVSSKPLEATLDGKLNLGDDGRVYATITLQPNDPLQATDIQMKCQQPDFQTTRTENILWPALQAARDLKLVFPMESGYTDSNLADLIGPTGGLLEGSIKIQTSLSR